MTCTKALDANEMELGLGNAIGQRVEAVWVDATKQDLAIQLANGTTLYAAPDGDCCSISWVAHVSGVADLAGAVIVGAEKRPEYATQNNAQAEYMAHDSEPESLALYGITLVTDRGHRVDIDYRNESNGYYGGWLNWNEGSSPGAGWQLATEDW